MIELTTTDLRENLSEVINRVAYGRERVAVRRRAKTVAVLISPAEAELLKRLVEEEENRIDVAEARRARAKGGKPIPLAEAAARLAIKLPKRGKPRTDDGKRAAKRKPRR
jgi:prevent-host-death family protein